MKYSNVICEIEIIIVTPDDIEPTLKDATEVFKELPNWNHVSNIRIVHSVTE